LISSPNNGVFVALQSTATATEKNKREKFHTNLISQKKDYVRMQKLETTPADVSHNAMR